MTQPTPKAATPEQAEYLRSYANMTQSLLPRVGDSVKVELPTGERWVCTHMPSKAQIEARRANQSRTMRQGCAFVALLYAVAFLFPVVQNLVTNRQGHHTVQLVGGGIVLLALAAWLAWSKPRVIVPKEDT